MSLIKINKRRPWFSSELSDFFDNEDLFRDEFWGKAIMKQPAMNIKETDGKYTIEVAAPGLEKEDFKVSVKDGQLTISAEKESSTEEKKENYARREFSYNSFKRSLMLPDNVLEDQIDASYENGMLNITLNKKEMSTKHPSRMVEVH